MGVLAVHVLVDRIDHRRGELFAGQSVTTADNGDVLPGESGLDVEEKRLAEAAGLLAAVEDRNLFDGRRQRLDEHIGSERAIETNLQETELPALRIQVADRLFDGLAGGTHRDDDLVGVGGADVIKQVILAAGDFADLVHVLLDDGRERLVLLVGRLAALEVDVRILGGHLRVRSIRAQRAVAETLDVLHVEHRLHVGVIEQLDLLELMGGAEAVEEREERDFALERREVGDEREVVGLLDRRGGGHRVTGRAAAHHVGMVAEDRQRLGREGAGRNVEDGREHLAGDLVHVRNHQQQPLAGRVGRGQRTGRKRTVHRTGSAGFGLHFNNFKLLAEHVLLALAGPDVGVLAHRRGRGDRVDRRHLAERVGNVRRRVIPVDGLHFFSHDSSVID